jgi:hypothetical protein
MLFSACFYLLGLGTFVYTAHLAGLVPLDYVDPATLLGMGGILGLTLLIFPAQDIKNTLLCRTTGDVQQAQVSKWVLRSLRRSQGYGVALSMILGLFQLLQAAAVNEKVMASLGAFLAIGLLSCIYWLLMHLFIYQPLESFWDKQLQA